MNNTTKFIVGAGLRHAAHQPGHGPGATAALLFAPQSGEQTREQLTKAGEDAIAQGQRVVEDSRERAEAIIADAQRRAERIAEAARSNVN